MDFSAMRLGRRPPLPASQSRRARFEALLGIDLPQPAQTRNWSPGVTSRPMWGNDTAGDCTCVTFANGLTTVAKAAYEEDLTIQTSQVIGLYEKVTQPPYDPSLTDKLGNNPTDNGAVFENVVTFVLKNGFDNHHLIGSAAIDPGNSLNIKRAIDWYGVAAFGVQLPLAWQTASAWTLDGYSEGDPNWQVGSWGGHEIIADQYDENGVYVWSWGQKIFFSFEAIAKFCDEVDALVFASWIKNGLSPAGIDLSKLENWAAGIRAS